MHISLVLIKKPHKLKVYGQEIILFSWEYLKGSVFYTSYSLSSKNYLFRNTKKPDCSKTQSDSGYVHVVQ